MQTIKDLWYGKIGPCDHCGSCDPELNHLTDLMERSREDLNKISTPQQMDIFEKYIDCADEYSRLMMEQAFCEGFCLASRIMAEALLAGV